MDRRAFSFRQIVRHTDLNGLQEDLAQAVQTNTRDLLGAGILAGGRVSACTTPDMQHVLLCPTLAWDNQGRRIHVRHRLTDCVSAVIPLSVLQEEGISDVPKGNGTLLLLAQQGGNSSSCPFSAFQPTGKIALLRCASHPPRSYTITQTVSTTLGGLIPQQTAVCIADALPQAGYAAGVPPTGTSFTVDIVSNDPLQVDVSRNQEGKEVLPTQKGTCRIVSLYARFAHNTLDWRLDGHGKQVAHRQLQHFQLLIDASAAAAKADTAQPPALHSNSDVFLADVRLRYGQPIEQNDIDTSRQTHLHSLQALQPQYTADLLHMAVFGDGRVQWKIEPVAQNGNDNTNKQAQPSPSGTCTLTGDVHVLLAGSALTHTLPAFKQPLQDKQALWVLLPRQAKRSYTLTTTVLSAEKFPPHAPNQIPWQLAQRRGDTLYGWPLGRLQSGHSRCMGEGISHETQQTLTTHGDSIQQLQKDTGELKQNDTDTNKRLQLLEQRIRSQIRHMRINTLGTWACQHKPFPQQVRLRRLQTAATAQSQLLAMAVYSHIAYLYKNGEWRISSFTPPFPLQNVQQDPLTCQWLGVGGKPGEVYYCEDKDPNKWTTLDTGAKQHLYGCAHNHNRHHPLWVLVGEKGAVLTASTPKGPFQKQTSPKQVANTRLRHVVHNHKSGSEGRWIVTAQNGSVLTSKDGKQWQMVKLDGYTEKQKELMNDSKHVNPPEVIWHAPSNCFYLFDTVLFGDEQTKQEYTLLFTSLDGLSWKQQKSRVPSSWNPVVGDGLWCVSPGGPYLFVTDCPIRGRWQQLTGYAAGSLQSLAYSDFSRRFYYMDGAEDIHTKVPKIWHSPVIAPMEVESSS